tara:strand:- start:1357 stop:1575 length:219 start_codon:yes stop_codon:yes gene_type:complete
MVIGGYSMTRVFDSITVKHYEAGQDFFMQGDDATQFLAEWEQWQEIVDNNFRDFLQAHEYDTLFQTTFSLEI